MFCWGRGYNKIRIKSKKRDLDMRCPNGKTEELRPPSQTRRSLFLHNILLKLGQRTTFSFLFVYL